MNLTDKDVIRAAATLMQASIIDRDTAEAFLEQLGIDLPDRKVEIAISAIVSVDPFQMWEDIYPEVSGWDDQIGIVGVDDAIVESVELTLLREVK